MAARHQRRVRGRTDAGAVNEVFEWYGRYWLEIFRMPADVRRGIVLKHFDDRRLRAHHRRARTRATA